MIDLGSAGEQKEFSGTRGPIPPKSLVKVRLLIRKPKKPDPNDQAVAIFGTGTKGLDTVFEVVSGTYKGLEIYDNTMLPPSMQTVKLTKGQEGRCQGGFARCRAIIEATRNIDPQDPSGNRGINGWFDLHGLEFPVKVGIDQPKQGDQYVNNTILKVLPVTDPDFAHVMAGGEVVTDEPIPEIPQAQNQKQGSGGKEWGAGQNQKQSQQQTTEQSQQPQQQTGGPGPQETMPVPSWAQ